MSDQFKSSYHAHVCSLLFSNLKQKTHHLCKVRTLVSDRCRPSLFISLKITAPSACVQVCFVKRRRVCVLQAETPVSTSPHASAVLPAPGDPPHTHTSMTCTIGGVIQNVVSDCACIFNPGSETVLSHALCVLQVCVYSRLGGARLQYRLQ